MNISFKIPLITSMTSKDAKIASATIKVEQKIKIYYEFSLKTILDLNRQVF
jgi:hypothetical protein